MKSSEMSCRVSFAWIHTREQINNRSWINKKMKDETKFMIGQFEQLEEKDRRSFHQRVPLHLQRLSRYFLRKTDSSRSSSSRFHHPQFNRNVTFIRPLPHRLGLSDPIRMSDGICSFVADRWRSTDLIEFFEQTNGRKRKSLFFSFSFFSNGEILHWVEDERRSIETRVPIANTANDGREKRRENNNKRIEWVIFLFVIRDR